MDTSFDGYSNDFDTSYIGNYPFDEVTANQFLSSTGTTILKSDLEMDITRHVDNEIEISEIKSEYTQKTSASNLVNTALPKPIPLVEGIGALEFIDELEKMEYSVDVKEFYKGSRELVKKLNIL